MSFFYIASPYTHREPAVVHDRFKKVMHFTADVMQMLVPCYSPIVHCHELAATHKLPTTFEFWTKHNHAMIDVSMGILVLELDGWRESKGVKDEIDYALANGIRYFGVKHTPDWLDRISELYENVNR